jgi:glycosyltransferase involved in cell wall biosynthesis
MFPEKSTKTAVHFIPGDGPNGLIQAISMTSDLEVKILTLYTLDMTVPIFCKRNGIEIESLGFTKKDILKQAFKFIRYLYKEKPKLVFAHSFYPSLICAVGRFFYWKTTFVPVRHHNRVHILSKNRKAILLDQWISRVTTHTIAVSDSVKETLVEQGCKEKKISVIFNGLPKPPTTYAPQHKVGKSGPFKLIALGRIDWQKNYEGMLKVISVLRHGGVDLELNILGGGNQEYLAQLKRLQTELGISHCVTWSGRQTDIYKYLNESDLFIHTAIDEACPLVLIETLMYGIPVISSNLGGCRDVLNGYYAGRDPSDVTEFCNDILEVLGNLNGAKNYAESITDAASEKFSPIRMQHEYTSFSLSLL